MRSNLARAFGSVQNGVRSGVGSLLFGERQAAAAAARRGRSPAAASASPVNLRAVPRRRGGLFLQAAERREEKEEKEEKEGVEFPSRFADGIFSRGGSDDEAKEEKEVDASSSSSSSSFGGGSGGSLLRRWRRPASSASSSPAAAVLAAPGVGLRLHRNRRPPLADLLRRDRDPLPLSPPPGHQLLRVRWLRLRRQNEENLAAAGAERRRGTALYLRLLYVVAVCCFVVMGYFFVTGILALI